MLAASFALLACGGLGACDGGDETAGDDPRARPGGRSGGSGGAAGSSTFEEIPKGGAGGSGGEGGAGGIVTSAGGSSTTAGAAGSGTSAGGSATAAGSGGGGGIETGVGGSSTTGCVPKPEVCDGVVDDDCDGVLDNGCACVNGTTVPCQAACGAGVRTCATGALGACNGPGVDGSGNCPCPAGSFRGTSGGCYTDASCTDIIQGGTLKVSAGKTATKSMSCPAGLYAKEARYTGTSMPCSFSSSSTSATLTCKNEGGEALDADGLRLTCSCQKPGSVSYVCTNCNCKNCN